MNTQTKRAYTPAFGIKWLTPFYDPVLMRLMPEDRLKRQLITQVGFGDNQNVLDLGCGTGTLTIMVKEQYPTVNVVGLDADVQVIEIAERKAAQAGVNIRWILGMGGFLPFGDNSLDFIISSLMVHHLKTDAKRAAFQEVYRILKPGGEFHLLDFGAPHSFWMRLTAKYTAKLEETEDNLKGRIPLMLNEAGLLWIQEQKHYSTVFGPLSQYLAIKEPLPSIK